MRTYQHFINNKWHQFDGAGFIERTNPATGEIVARFATGTAADLDMAVAAARTAFDAGPWPQMTAQQRASILFKLADLLEINFNKIVDIEIEEVGKPRRFTEGDVHGAIAFTRHAAGMAAQCHGEAFSNMGPDRTGLVLRQPVGVAGIIVPWNFPIEIFAKKVPFALASGCCVVVKPSEMTSGSALEYAKLAAEAGMPEGVINVVTGKGSIVGEALTLHPGVNMVSFTGSTPVGQKILRNSAETTKRVTLELGGKSANIVFDDADFDSAIEGTLKGIFAFQGQCCVAGARLLVQENIADRFVARLVERTAQLKIGDPRDAATDIGSMISADHCQKVIGYIERAKSSDGNLVAGGMAVPPSNVLTENFVVPTIFDHVQPQSELFKDEVFGPVLSVTRFKDANDAIALANSTPYGLANAVWTSKLETAMTVSRRLESGIVWVNTMLDGAPQLPFGGIKASGFGRELGNAGFEDFTELKTILLSTTPYVSAFSDGKA